MLVLNLDLEDFFPSIHIGRFIGCLEGKGWMLGNEAATTIAQLCFDSAGVLPQGAPTSPVVSNIICSHLDNVLLGLAREFHLLYTRYADDLTFSIRRPSFPPEFASGSNGAVAIGARLRESIESQGFRINDSKTRLQYRTAHQEVTGLTSNEAPNVSRSYVRNLDTILHIWKTLGYESAYRGLVEVTGKPGAVLLSSPDYLRHHVRGKLAFLMMVKGRHDPVYRRLAWGFHQCQPEFFLAPRPLDALSSAPLKGARGAFRGWNTFANRYAPGILMVEVLAECTGDLAAATTFVVSDHHSITAGHVAAEKHLKVWVGESTEVPTYRLYANAKMGMDIGILVFEKPVFRHLPKLPILLRVPEVGESVAAMGYPRVPLRQPTHCLHSGSVEALTTNFKGDTLFIQTSFQSGGGLSGSPLIDQHGRVLGVMAENVFLKAVDGEAPPRAYGQAVPVEYAYQELQQLKPEGAPAVLSGWELR